MKLNELPYKSKLASAEQNGLKIRKYMNNHDSILYLGASSGTTVSYIASLFNKANIFAIDLAPLMLKQIVIDDLENVIPILADANQPKTYHNKVFTVVDIIYQDVAQRNQLEIFDKNIELFLRKDGFAMLAVKSRSIDTSKHPKEIFKMVEKHLKDKYKVLERLNIHKFQKDHMFYVIQKVN